MKVIIEAPNGEMNEIEGRNAFVFMEAVNQDDDGTTGAFVSVSGEFKLSLYPNIVQGLTKNIVTLVSENYLTKLKAIHLLAAVNDALDDAIDNALHELADTATPKEAAEFEKEAEKLKAYADEMEHEDFSDETDNAGFSS